MALPPAALLSLLAVASAQAARPYQTAAVAAQHHLGSEAGARMLARGGNAVDAAVATAFAMAVVGPYHSGLGGGGFAVLHLGDGGVEALDFREVAPAAAWRDMYLRDGGVVPGLSTDGALSVAVPTAVKGYLALHARHGTLPRAVVLAPAIELARKGFRVTPKYRDLATMREACLQRDAEAARLFLRPDDAGVPRVPPLGTVLRQPELAATLQALAARGEAAFYRGPVAAALVGTVQDAGGLLTRADLEAAQVRWVQPLEGSYRGHRVVTMPPPSAGGVALLQTLKVLERGTDAGVATHEVGALHLFLETLRRVYVERARSLGDPRFVEVPLQRLLSDEWAQQTLASIDPRAATRSSTLDAGLAPLETRHTTHLSVVDGQGRAVALTSTLNAGFGSCLVARGTGVLLNDQMDDFAAQPGVPNVYGLVQGEANAIAPGKAPLSSMTPTLVFQKGDASRVLLAVGSPGGSTIPTTVLQVVSQVVDGQVDVVRAVSAGRVHHQWLPDDVLVDRPGLEPATRAALEALGHRFRFLEAWGDAEVVMVHPRTGLVTAASDPRNEGAPAGLDEAGAR